MSESIIIALIAAVGAVLGQWALGKANNKELYEKLDKQSELADEKIKGRMDVFQSDLRTLSNRVEAHNKVVERTYKLEERMSVAEERISDAHHRINDISNG